MYNGIKGWECAFKPIYYMLADKEEKRTTL